MCSSEELNVLLIAVYLQMRLFSPLLVDSYLGSCYEWKMGWTWCSVSSSSPQNLPLLVSDWIVCMYSLKCLVYSEVAIPIPALLSPISSIVLVSSGPRRKALDWVTLRITPLWLFCVSWLINVHSTDISETTWHLLQVSLAVSHIPKPLNNRIQMKNKYDYIHPQLKRPPWRKHQQANLM